MPKCKIILEPVQTKDRIYVNGDTLEADEATVTGLVNIGVAVPITEEINKPQLKPETSLSTEPVTPRRRKQQVEETEGAV